MTKLPRFAAANRIALKNLYISRVSETNPHRPGTPTYDAFLPFIGTTGMNLWDLWKSGRNPAHLAYRINSGVIAIAERIDDIAPSALGLGF